MDGDANRTDADEAESRSESQFDTLLMSETVACPRFACYVDMVAKIDGIPDELTSWASFCVCHRQLCKRYSNHNRHKQMAMHFGPSYRECPLSGCVAPEMVDGEIFRALDDVWSQTLACVCLPS